MVTSPGEGIMEMFKPIVILVGRVVFGVCLAIVLSTVGIAIAWGLFIFSGSQSLTAWLTSMYFGAGFGAGVSGLAAWVRLDHETQLSLATTMIVAVSAGVAGALAGYQYGQTQEIECCAMPTKSPLYFTAIGATVGANVGAILLVSLRGINAQRQNSLV